jgi:aminoglycoside phosphotransferase (APT) family kinase protein
MTVVGVDGTTGPARARRLAGRLAELLPEDASSIELTRLSGGASRENWLVRAAGSGRPRYVLRLGTDLGTEAALLDQAAIAGVPVPGVVLSGDADEVFGPGFLLTRFVDGETIPRRVLRDDRLADARRKLAGQLGSVLARIHALPREGIQAKIPVDPADLLAQYETDIDATGQPHPAFEIALRWLTLHRPAPREHVLLHGDFRLGNLMIDQTGLVAVLDWELAHLGDARFDLGWLCSPSWRFGGPGVVAGTGTREELLAAYASAGGGLIDLAELSWFEVLATLRWGILCVRQSLRFLDGESRSAEFAALGRRVCEVEWELLRLVES